MTQNSQLRERCLLESEWGDNRYICALTEAENLLADARRKPEGCNAWKEDLRAAEAIEFCVREAIQNADRKRK